MSLALIYARTRNGVIGAGGSIPWHLTPDLAHFRQLTKGCAVIMGRKTWDSLPVRFRPLPGRVNIVVTRQECWNEAGARRAASLQQAIEIAGTSLGGVWVIGGAQLYAQALPLAYRVEVTELQCDCAGDAFAPELGPEWQETARTAHAADSDLPYSFVSYRRRG